MTKREDYFRIERAYLVHLGQVDEKLTDYRRADRAATEKTKRIEEEFADEWDRCTNALTCRAPTQPTQIQ